MYVFAGQMRLQDTEPYDRGLYERLRFERVRERVAELAAQGKSLRFEGGHTIGYDRLLLAVGSRARPAPWPGAAGPGLHYFVQGKTDLTTTNWVAVSPTITATDTLTTYCIPLPSPYHFFRVHEGLSALATPIAGPPTISGISRSGSGVTIHWTASASNQFRIQWANSLPIAAWNTLSTVVTSANGNFSFTDDGSQTGGLGGQRFYRLQQVP